ncbi:uncharacterized protein LOC127051082 [Gopherus flavomarginatus]|uniref:uncharacterized protein LOC127051082 n=1 Tax=Gopherus flavomarginatus TaxID=286002 RepID=UPI0021CC1E5D|nr:uncharacterized protein LOC127051082 [Gopherus flavomarginatus]
MHLEELQLLFKDETFFLDIPDSALEALNFEQDGSQHQQTGFPEITEDNFSSVIPQEEMLKERSLKGAKKFLSESATVGNKGIKPPPMILNNPAQSNPSLHSQMVLKRAKKSTSETATVSRGGEKGLRPPYVEPLCTSQAKTSTSAASRDIDYLFSDYIKTHLRQRQEASGFPHLCSTKNMHGPMILALVQQTDLGIEEELGNFISVNKGYARRLQLCGIGE